jgi:hypothetical protein
MKVLQRDYVVYKKVKIEGAKRPGIATLILTEGTMVRREIGKDPIDGDLKNRASRAYVAAINTWGGSFVEEAYSLYDRWFRYTVGKVVRPVCAFNRTQEQCESGIHFYETAADARNS